MNFLEKSISGNGVCGCGVCRCKQGYTDVNCECPDSTDSCTDSNTVVT